MKASDRVIRRTLIGYIAPFAILLFLLLSNFLTRASAVRRMIGLDDRPIIVSLEASEDTLLAVERAARQAITDTVACLEPALSRGRAELRKNRYAAAIDLWREKLGSGCREEVLYANIALAWADSGIAGVADSMAAVALSVDSMMADAHRLRAHIAADEQRYDQAEESYLRALALRPHDAGAAFSLGVLYFQIKRYAAARDQFGAALRIGADKPRTWYNTGLCFHRMAMHDSAVFAYGEAIRFKPEYLAPRVNMAALYRGVDSLDKAEKLYVDIVKIAPGDIRARLELARLQIARKKFNAANRQLAALLRLDPDNLDARYEQTKILGLRGNDAEALKAYRAIVRSDPDNPRVFYNIGVNLMDMGKTEEAADAYVSALNRDPFFWKAAYNLGVFYLRQNRYAEAIQFLQRVAEINPEHLESAYNLGLAYLRSDQWSKALAMFESALEMDSTHLEALYNIGYVHLKRENNESALRYFRQTLHIDPRHDKSLYNAGLVFKRLDRCDSALVYFSKACEIREQFPEARFNSAVCYRSAGNFEAALAQIDSALLSDSTYERGLVFKAELLREIGKADSAIQTLRHARRLHRGSPAVVKSLAGTFYEQKNYSEALRYYHEYVKAESTDVSALRTVGVLERKNGNSARSVVYLRKAYDLDNENIDLIIDYGRALLEADRYTEARRIISRALDRFPDNIGLRQELAGIYEKAGNAKNAARQYDALGKITGDYDHILNAANHYLTAREYASALRQFRQAHALKPGEWRPFYYTSLMYSRLDSSGKARESWKTFTDSFPEDSRGYYQLGKLAADEQEWRRAAALLSQSLTLKEYRFSHYYLAESLYRLEQYQEALKHVDAYLKEDPESRRGQRLRRAIRRKMHS